MLAHEGFKGRLPARHALESMDNLAITQEEERGQTLPNARTRWQSIGQSQTSVDEANVHVPVGRGHSQRQQPTCTLSAFEISGSSSESNCEGQAQHEESRALGQTVGSRLGGKAAKAIAAVSRPCDASCMLAGANTPVPHGTAHVRVHVSGGRARAP